VIEWDTALSAGGALEAAIEARDEGLVRFIGVTGHGLSVAEMHRRSLERFPFDSVLCPYNYVQMQDDRYARTFDALATVCAERNVALQTIKSLASRRWDGRTKTASTWYEPLREQADIDLAAHWVLGNPQAFLLTTGDVELLPGCSTRRALRAAPRRRAHGRARSRARARAAVRVAPAATRRGRGGMRGMRTFNVFDAAVTYDPSDPAPTRPGAAASARRSARGRIGATV
jgi:hypothetical protein